MAGGRGAGPVSGSSGWASGGTAGPLTVEAEPLWKRPGRRGGAAKRTTPAGWAGRASRRSRGRQGQGPHCAPGGGRQRRVVGCGAARGRRAGPTRRPPQVKRVQAPPPAFAVGWGGRAGRGLRGAGRGLRGAGSHLWRPGCLRARRSGG